MYEKMGLTLSDSGRYDIYLIGYPSNDIPAYAGIHFLPLKPFSRLSIGRLLAPLKVLLKCYQLKPEVLIVNTHELLIVSLINRILFGTLIIYDIRENYFRNIIHSEAFPLGIKQLLALWVRLKEKLTSPLFHHFILAEKAYKEEMKFFGNRYTIIENKTRRSGPIKPRQKGDKINLIFTGTLADSTGVFKAIKLAKALHEKEGKITLTIIGYAARQSVQSRLAEEARKFPFIRLVGVTNLVPHTVVLEEILNSNFGIIYYPPSHHTSGSRPTKLYEYMAFQLPIITWPNQSFTTQVLESKAGILVSNYEQVLTEIKTTSFYPNPIPDTYWEGDKFIQVIDQVLG